MKPNNDWERVLELLTGFVVGNLMEEDHLATCQRLLEAEKLLRRIDPERLREAKQKVKDYRKSQGIE